MVPVALANSVKYFVLRVNSRNARAPSGFAQFELMAHCHDAPPIFGPSPKSTGGRISRSSPSFSTFLAASQLPSHWIADLPLRKSSLGLEPDFWAMYPSVTNER